MIFPVPDLRLPADLREPVGELQRRSKTDVASSSNDPDGECSCTTHIAVNRCAPVLFPPHGK
jgi:hypothetical protein